LESVVNPIENKAFELVGGEFLSSLASVKLDKRVESSKEPPRSYGEITPQGMSNEEASKK
jgi:hypothetical protein